MTTMITQSLVLLLALLQGPSGETRLFNGVDLKGWHVSEVNHHGNSHGWTVKDGILLATQDKPGNGGILLTDRRYRNFEISLEINPDWGCDGGLFLRSSEKGEAYQVTIDYLQGGIVGSIYGEELADLSKLGKGDLSARGWEKVWKKGEWNKLRARIEGDIPHIQVWLNDTRIVDWTDSANHAAGGAVDGMVALQMHRSDTKTPRWHPGGYHRFRNIILKEL
jgi:hypothetical protein